MRQRDVYTTRPRTPQQRALPRQLVLEVVEAAFLVFDDLELVAEAADPLKTTDRLVQALDLDREPERAERPIVGCCHGYTSSADWASLSRC